MAFLKFEFNKSCKDKEKLTDLIFNCSSKETFNLFENSLKQLFRTVKLETIKPSEYNVKSDSYVLLIDYYPVLSKVQAKQSINKLIDDFNKKINDTIENLNKEYRIGELTLSKNFWSNFLKILKVVPNKPLYKIIEEHPRKKKDIIFLFLKNKGISRCSKKVKENMEIISIANKFGIEPNLFLAFVELLCSENENISFEKIKYELKNASINNPLILILRVLSGKTRGRKEKALNQTVFSREMIEILKSYRIDINSIDKEKLEKMVANSDIYRKYISKYTSYTKENITENILNKLKFQILPVTFILIFKKEITKKDSIISIIEDYVSSRPKKEIKVIGGKDFVIFYLTLLSKFNLVYDRNTVEKMYKVLLSPSETIFTINKKLFFTIYKNMRNNGIVLESLYYPTSKFEKIYKLVGEKIFNIYAPKAFKHVKSSSDWKRLFVKREKEIENVIKEYFKSDIAKYLNTFCETGNKHIKQDIVIHYLNNLFENPVLVQAFDEFISSEDELNKLWLETTRNVTSFGKKRNTYKILINKIKNDKNLIYKLYDFLCKKFNKKEFIHIFVNIYKSKLYQSIIDKKDDYKELIDKIRNIYSKPEYKELLKIEPFIFMPYSDVGGYAELLNKRKVINDKVYYPIGVAKDVIFKKSFLSEHDKEGIQLLSWKTFKDHISLLLLGLTSFIDFKEKIIFNSNEKIKELLLNLFNEKFLEVTEISTTNFTELMSIMSSLKSVLYFVENVYIPILERAGATSLYSIQSDPFILTVEINIKSNYKEEILYDEVIYQSFHKEFILRLKIKLVNNLSNFIEIDTISKSQTSFLNIIRFYHSYYKLGEKDLITIYLENFKSVLYKNLVKFVEYRYENIINKYPKFSSCIIITQKKFRKKAFWESLMEKISASLVFESLITSPIKTVELRIPYNSIRLKLKEEFVFYNTNEIKLPISSEFFILKTFIDLNQEKLRKIFYDIDYVPFLDMLFLSSIQVTPDQIKTERNIVEIEDIGRIIIGKGFPIYIIFLNKKYFYDVFLKNINKKLVYSLKNTINDFINSAENIMNKMIILSEIKQLIPDEDEIIQKFVWIIVSYLLYKKLYILIHLTYKLARCNREFFSNIEDWLNKPKKVVFNYEKV